MTTNPFRKMDVNELKRRIANEEFALSKFQAHADLINRILDHVDAGTIDSYCQDWSESIRQSIIRLETMKLELAMKSLKEK